MTTDALRARLGADQAALVKVLAETPADQMLEPGFVRMLADIQTALAAVEAIAITKE